MEYPKEENGMQSQKRIPLNLIFDYPVQWSKYKVLRDLIQNFYDSVGYQHWKTDFQCEVKDERITLQALQVGFSYEWLIHIGASTKREVSGKYAGFFGEGFKIASLCALRDYQWQIEMCSQNWELKVITSPIIVDGKTLLTLSYDVCVHPDFRQDTILRLYPFLKNDQDILESVLLSFYYEENPLFGEKIWTSSSGAVFERSKIPKPPHHYPSTFEYSGDGIIFVGYQALGSFPYPFIFCYHQYHFEDRERNNLYQMNVIDIIQKIVKWLSPEASLAILQGLKRLWYQYPHKKYDFDSWYSIIYRLAKNISSSQEHVRSFRKQFPHLLVAKKVDRRNIYQVNRRHQALAWMRNAQVHKFRLVQDGFLFLDYPTLEDVCNDAGGFNLLRNPMPKESQYILILEEITNCLIPHFFEKDILPRCKIIHSDSGVWKGMTSCISLSKTWVNSYGLKVRFRLEYISLKEYLFVSHLFGDALGTYWHELSHVFGGDQSAVFSGALSILLDVSLTKSHIIDQYKKKWDILES